ncbi:MAG TPA: ABC transporter permease [Streptosporangiaceae bacterium]|nr:ABC transporter permease [Streptosporangiaceae bacterium]
MSAGITSVLAPRGGTLELGGTLTQQRGTWRETRWLFRHDRFAMTGLALVALIAVLAIVAPLIALLVGHTPNQTFDAMVTAQGLPRGPSASFLFGGDQVGRDVFVRTIYGARTSLTVALTAAVVSTILGLLIGMVAGYYGGFVDVVLSRIIDVFLALPILLFAISISTVASVTTAGALGGLLKPGIGLVTAVIAFFSWPYLARIVRGQVIALREREFVQAAQVLGAGDARIMWHEVLPNVISPVLVYLTLIVPSNVLFEAALSYFGLGVPESTPSWGQMLADATANSLFTYAWWMMLFPGLFLFITMLGFNLIGDGVRDAFDKTSGSAAATG